MELRVGKKYRLGRKIGSGSFGAGSVPLLCPALLASGLDRPLCLPARHSDRRTAASGFPALLRVPNLFLKRALLFD